MTIQRMVDRLLEFLPGPIINTTKFISIPKETNIGGESGCCMTSRGGASTKCQSPLTTSEENMPDNFEEYNRIVDETWNHVHRLSHLKGGEYAGDKDRLANFRRNAEALGIAMETVWAVYAAKHWDAIMQFVKDITTKTDRVRSEPIEGRIDDLIVYLLLFKAILAERPKESVLFNPTVLTGPRVSTVKPSM